MKKIIILIMAAVILFVSYQVAKDYLFPGPKTFIKVYEGATSVYFMGADGEREFLGTFKQGESITVLSANKGPFAFLNVTQFFVPKAAGIFKKVVGRKAEKRPVGVYQRLFTAKEFQKFITRKITTPFWPDANVAIGPDGFKATAMLTIGNFRVPIYGSGIVNVDEKKHGLLYVEFYEAGIGKFRVPQFLLNWVAKESNKVMNRGNFSIEIQAMKYKQDGIDITFLKTDAPIEGTHTESSVFPQTAMEGAAVMAPRIDQDKAIETGETQAPAPAPTAAE